MVTILIDSDRCKGCGRCVAACPQKLISLEPAGTRKTAARKNAPCPSDCFLCVSACPYGVMIVAQQA